MSTAYHLERGENMSTEQRLIRLPEVMNLTGLARPTVYLYIKQGKFPKAIKIGTSSFWEYNQIQGWISDRLLEQH